MRLMMTFAALFFLLASLGSVYAQSFDPRITQLEEQIRQLNGRIEEMNFQILQMQEALRKAQEDNEFRLQQLEEKRSDAGTEGTTQRAAIDERPTDDTERQTLEEETSASNGTLPGVEWSSAGESTKLGSPPRNLGTLSVDEEEAEGENAARDNTTVAALPPVEDSKALYDTSYQMILSGDYKAAETGFRDYGSRFPDGDRRADAQYWLGEALLGQERFSDAAEVFLEGTKTFPNSRKAPDMMLKLGVTLSAMQKTDIACATLGAVEQKFPKISMAMKERVVQEKALAGC